MTQLILYIRPTSPNISRPSLNLGASQGAALVWVPLLQGGALFTVEDIHLVYILRSSRSHVICLGPPKPTDQCSSLTLQETYSLNHQNHWAFRRGLCLRPASLDFVCWLASSPLNFSGYQRYLPLCMWPEVIPLPLEEDISTGVTGFDYFAFIEVNFQT